MTRTLKRILIWTAAVGTLATGAVALDVFVLARHGSAHPNPKHNYIVVKDHWLPAVIGSGATTMDDRVLVRRGLPTPPSAKGLAHEFYHTEHTSWLRYALVPSYRAGEEAGANAYSAAHWQEFETDARVVAIRWGVQ